MAIIASSSTANQAIPYPKVVECPPWRGRGMAICRPYRSLMGEGFMTCPLSPEAVVNPPDWHIETF